MTVDLPPQLVVCTALGGARGADAAAAAVAVSGAEREAGEGVLLLDLRAATRAPRGTLLASASARAIESICSDRDAVTGAARGRICFAVANGSSGEAREAALGQVLDPSFGAVLVVCVCDPHGFRPHLARGAVDRRAALIRASPGAERSLLALATRELLAERIPVKAWTAPIGMVPGRRALAGLEPGGESGRRAARFAERLAPPRRARRATGRMPSLRAENAQAMPAVLGIAVLVVAVALILAALGGAASAKGRLQRAADLAALSAARSMRDDLPRLFLPALTAGGHPNPAHLSKDEYLERARWAAAEAAERNGIDSALARVSFPDGRSFAPLRVEVDAEGEIGVRGNEASGETTSVDAEAAVAPLAPTAPGSPAGGGPATASGGGYGGPLAYRQGKPMRPDVAAAFDRMAAAAAAAGVPLTINSGYRSDAEQQELWEANPDPRMVAPPGTSLHRCGTELDLGPSAAYGWLAANAGRFGFLQRYSWEAWHYGYVDGPEPCSAEGESGGAEGASGPDGKLAGSGGLPAFVPAQYRGMLIASAARHDVSAALLAAQIMAESNFNPNAVSPAGAQGIAQFMPATAIAYGLDDPFDPEQAIEAQATMMGELLAQFGSVELALAAYNAGPGAVASCDCIPPYPETQAYVVRIMGLLDGAGELVAAAPVLEVRLVD